MQLLKTFQVFFYLLFVLLWFKDNFAVLRKIKIPSGVPLVCLIVISAFLWRYRGKGVPLKPKLRWNRKLTALVLLMGLVSLGHLPYFLNSYGLMDSDEAIPALMGKHIAEGKVPPLYYYGALFQGSLPQHYYALLFKIFGFSVFLAKLAAFLVFLAFLAVHLVFLQEIFSFSFALVAGFFYCLPWRHLIVSSVDLGSGFPVVFLFGSLIFALTYLIYDKDKGYLVAPVGFLSGLAFWTHQISFIFILTSSFFLVCKFKLQWKKYLKIILYFFVGAFPVILSEAFMGFRLVRLLLSGEAGTTSWQKAKRLKDFLLALVSSEPVYLGSLCLFVLLAGIIVLTYTSWINLKKRKILPRFIFVLYFLAFVVVYLFSDFSNVPVIRYFYILYLALPVLLGPVFFLIRNTKIRTLATAAFFLLLFILGNAKSAFYDFQSIKSRHLEREQVLRAMEETGEKYWQAEYWISYLMNALSKEHLIVASTTIERYPFYKLAYDSEMTHSNFIFLRDNPDAEYWASVLERSLAKFNVDHKKKEIRRWLLLYKIHSNVFPKNLFFPPEEVPSIVMEQVVPSPTGLEAHFANKNKGPTNGFQLHIEIPEYCSKSTPLPSEPTFEVNIPRPPKNSFAVHYHLEHFGFSIGSSFRRKEVTLSAKAVPPYRRDIEYLFGIGPPVEVANMYRHVCAKEVRIQLNRPLHYSSQIYFFLFSPFFFEDFFWHNRFSQEVVVFVNGQPLLTKSLIYGENLVPLDCRFPPFQRGINILTLKFKYAKVLSFRDYWKTAAYLSQIVVK